MNLATARPWKLCSYRKRARSGYAGMFEVGRTGWEAGASYRECSLRQLLGDNNLRSSGQGTHTKKVREPSR